MSQITEDSLIGDILNAHPEAADIMEAYGLHCTSCSVNQFEPIKAGAMSHGMPEETVNKMMEDLKRLESGRPKAPSDSFYVTAFAAEKIGVFGDMEEKSGWALRINARLEDGVKEPTYTMDFEEEAKAEDQVHEFHGVRILTDSISFENLKGATVDYIEGPFGSGFKIDNPRFKKGGCCGGSGEGCGCDTNGSKSGSCGCS